MPFMESLLLKVGGIYQYTQSGREKEGGTQRRRERGRGGEAQKEKEGGKDRGR